MSGPILFDPLAIHMAALTVLAGIAGIPLALATERGLALLAGMLAALLVALLARDLPWSWLGMAGSVLALVAALRADGQVAAAWRLFLVGGAALALALAGAALFALASRGDGWLLSVGFVVSLLGWATLAGLVPLHAAMLGALAAPAPLTSFLGGLVPGVALVAILRGRALLAANPDATAPGPVLLALGLLSLGLAGLTLRRQRADAVLAVASVGQFGVVAFAFGLGSEVATAAGLLHLTLLTLVRAAIGLRALVGVGLMALAGLPPFGLFSSLFLIVTETTRQAPWLAVPLVLGLVGCAWTLTARAVALWRQAPAAAAAAARLPLATLLPAGLLLAATAVLGLAMPGPAGAWFGGIARALR